MAFFKENHQLWTLEGLLERQYCMVLQSTGLAPCHQGWRPSLAYLLAVLPEGNSFISMCLICYMVIMILPSFRSYSEY